METAGTLIALAALLGTEGVTDLPNAAAPDGDARAHHIPISFRYDVIPALTKAGCNAGTCHGTPTGKNGFRLSLRGFDAVLDLQSLTREVHGRRIDRLDPHRSLILLKATAQVPHEGGRRFAVGSEFHELLRRWVAEGAQDDPADAASVVSLDANPPRQIVELGESPQSIRVAARFSDGSERDVTSLARFSVNDESVASIAADGRLERHRRGEVTVAAEFASRFATATIVFRAEPPGYVWSNPPEHNEIDRLVFEKLRLLAIEPSPLCTDTEFVRRVHLDAIGRLPSADEVRAFLADGDPEKRAKLIDALLARPEFSDWWAMKWADRLGCNQRFVGKTGAIKYHAWIKHAMAVNMPHDEFVREIITAGGPNYTHPASGFWRRLRRGGIGREIDPLLAAEEISQLFLGVRIQCARCHNHPQERWTQSDYYGLAAFFPRLRFRPGPFVNHQYDQEEMLYLIDDGDVDHPATGQAMSPTVLDGEPQATGTAEDRTDRRLEFARWLTAPENPFFARAAVNRMWYYLFGRGIVEPVDDFRQSNPPSHRDLLGWLEAEFSEHGYDRKYVIREILNSRTYQLSSRTTPGNTDDDRYFSHAQVRLLGAEQLLDAISQATDVPEAFPGLPPGTRAAELPDGEYKHPLLESFGRPARALACECERDSGINLEQALHLVSGRIVHDKVQSDTGRAARLAASGDDDAVLDELFLSTLSRTPTDEERGYLRGRLANADNRRRTIEDLLWALLNHEEFLFQH